VCRPGRSSQKSVLECVLCRMCSLYADDDLQKKLFGEVKEIYTHMYVVEVTF
jgi:hypothetical protein